MEKIADSRRQAYREARQVSEPTLQTVPDGWEFIYGGSVSRAYIPAEQGEGGLPAAFLSP